VDAFVRDVLMPHLAWRLDGVALMFLVPVLAVSAVAALFAPRYLEQPHYLRESRARFWLCYVPFVAGMAGVALAADWIVFLVCWEVMTLASYALVAYETREPAALRAAFKYFVMTHVGAAALLFAIVLLAVASGSFAFADLRPTLALLAVTRPALLHAVLGLLFVGFATKAGLWPFGDWLPDAHPAAPAPVSAVLSGVMIKLGLYGVLRVFVEALAVAAPGPAVTWGWTLAAFGLASALAGGFAACAAQDAKVVLAYSSVAQSGIVTLGLGAALVLAPAQPALAALALVGAAFHAVGDAFVKALLFLNAGAVQWRTGSRRLEDLGGLFEAMPVTGWTALIGSLAIAGFPPLTAFTAKWLLLQATVLSGEPVLAVGGLGLLVASLASVLYAVKLFAAVFANRPMRPGPLEVGAPMRAAMLALALPVLALAVAPGPALAVLARALAPAAPFVTRSAEAFGGLAVGPPSGAFAPLALVALAALAAMVARAALGRAIAPEARPVWSGGVSAGRGTPPPHPRGYYSPVRESLRRAWPALRVHWPSRPAWIPPAADPDRWLYRPALAAGRRVTDALRLMHTGVPHVYLAWQLAGALALAVLLAALLHR
jgi:hydrogenase-4 component B